MSQTQKVNIIQKKTGATCSALLWRIALLLIGMGCMQTLTNYQVIAKLHESSNSQVFRARRMQDDLPVVLKLLREAYPPPERIAWFRREYEITRSVELPGVIKAYSLSNSQGHWLLEVEDFGGDSLTHLLKAGPMALEEVLQVGSAVAGILSDIHRLNLIHKDINPSNIVYNRATGEVKLIDFGISTRLSRETPTFRNPDVIEGTILYMSPEQTGRMNRALDYRTDLYSLGATLYELLTGQPPFQGSDLLELVHSHIARQPEPPHVLRPDIPPMVSTIVLKLLAKNAEDRYQSGSGVQADLRRCLDEWQQHGHVASFPPGSDDVSEQLIIPQMLYGREHDIARLREAFERTAQGQRELLLVAGAPGMGKSVLVQELYKPVTARRGYFVTGKYDQMQRGTPYVALLEAFSGLIRYLLTGSDEQLAHWRRLLKDALGANAAVITEVLPDLEYIIGTPARVPALPPAEAQNRFISSVQNFVRVFTRTEHPLVIFLDDMQWADSASLALLQRLLSTPSEQRDQALLIIGTYRDNEMDNFHPLRQMLHQLEQVGTPAIEVRLTPLTTQSVRDMLTEVLHRPPAELQPLAELVTAKTGGNPFFISEFLKALYVKELIGYNARTRRWEWDLHGIQSQQMTNNVADLLADSIRQLDPACQHLIQLAGCIGHQFDLDILARIAKQPPITVARQLEPALQVGLIIPLSEAYLLATSDVPGLASETSTTYAFAHDRIQQAVYEMLPTTQRAAQHWQIGLTLWHTLTPEQLDDQIFEVVAHLNHGYSYGAGKQQQVDLATLNLQAARKAQQSAAFQASFTYCATGIALLDDDAWQQHYELALDLHTRYAQAAYLTGDQHALQEATRAVLQHARDLLDTIEVYDTNLQASAARQQFREAIQTVRPVLAQLGVELPEAPTPEDMGNRMQAIQAFLNGRSFEQIAALDSMTDPHQLAIMRLLAGAFSAAYIGEPALMPIVVFEQVLHSLRHGHAPSSPFAYANYGLLLCALFNDIPTGSRFGQLALRLQHLPGTTYYHARTLITSNFFITHWTNHTRTTLEPLLEAYRVGIETGDFEYAGYGVYMHTCHAFLCGTELSEMLHLYATTDEALERLQQPRTRQFNQLYWQLVDNLVAGAIEPWRLTGTYFHEEATLPLWQDANDVPALANICFARMFGALLLQDYQHAAMFRDALRLYQAGLIGSVYVPLFHFYDALIDLARLHEQPETREEQQRAVLERVDDIQAQLHVWAELAPMNIQHRWCLLEAERQHLLGNDGAARELYDQAITLAGTHGYLSEEALANEMTGRFYLRKRNTRQAQLYLREAYQLYVRWGAQSKVRDLEVRYPRLLLQPINNTNRHTISITNTGSNTARLDLGSIVKAYQTISSEIVMENLLGKLLQTVIENAGAERGLLILNRNNQLLVQAEGFIGSPHVSVMQAQPLDTADIPHTLINFVARTRESVVLHDAAHEERFAQDQYILARQPRSILCSPLINQGHLSGLFYLENNQAIGAFTEDRLEILSLLSGQVAISLENANLYAHLEDLVSERTAELSAAYETVKELNNRLEAELNLARRIQRSLLPPPHPRWSTLDVICYTNPARQVGGDLYAYQQLSPQHHVLAVGDVSGKGMPAALLMSVTAALFRTMLNTTQDPTLLLEQMDSALMDYTGSTRQNCAMVYADLQRASDTPDSVAVELINAGCVAPIIKRADGSVTLTDLGGMPLGVGLGALHGYEKLCLDLQTGDTLILSSDGVVEAGNVQNEMYGFERLEEAIRTAPTSSAEAILNHIRTSLVNFIGNTEPSDDITLLIIRV